ncbi:hypothetical protein [Sphingobacterium haloxyli]|uniref:Peptidase S74 domain-containing protein n=1 Tax=Sphingobacterium haloxyli TaxID=2100533 RepID=A0A2S9IVI5_9SPHI|nr:hypothetical protein [Sphingobacterium haloxyli]PRD44541.1 hypothetical protein C5745_19375 [Sphingobacterium haloxyli]
MAHSGAPAAYESANDGDRAGAVGSEETENQRLTYMKANYFVLLLLLCWTTGVWSQTRTTASVNGAGWKRVAYCNSPAGRGFGRVTLYTTGGAATPYHLDIEWFKDWTVAGGITVKSNSKTAYWTQARLTFDQDTTFIEVNFARAVSAVTIMSDAYGWNVARGFSGVLPDGGGTVRAEARVGKMAIDDYLTVAYNGNVGIGTTTPDTKLAVNGNIRAREIKVETANWPDYVFREDYELPSLDFIRAYIAEHGHLPEIPSAAEVGREGIALGEINALLLKKIEELTLLLMEKDEQLKKQGEAIDKLSSEMEIVRRILNNDNTDNKPQ